MKTAYIKGIVTPFQGNGRKLGYPTANLRIETDLKDGVYFGFADLNEHVHQPALIFIGTPTTLHDHERRVEAYLLDIPDVDYYGDEINLEILHFHRQNQTFGGISELQTVMKNDELEARRWFAETNSGTDRA